MKKKIFVNLVLFLELVMLVVYIINAKFITSLGSIVPFNYVILANTWCIEKLQWLGELIKIPDVANMLFKTSMPVLEVIITLTLVNIAWIIVFYLIFGTIGAIIKSSSRKKRRKLISEYKLTPTEEKRFAPENYKKKAGRWVKKTMIIPLLLIALFVFVRFDVRNIRAWKPLINNEYGFEIYYKGILPVFDLFSDPFTIDDIFHVLFTNVQGWGYFDLINKYLSEYGWVEYILISVASILLLFIWWGLFKIISLIFRKGACKRLSRKATRKYIDKMEKQEFKLRKKYNDDAIAKGDEFLRIIEEELKDDALEIAKIKNEKSSRHQKKIDARKKAYLEEIGYGVVDLGVSNEETKDSKEPIVEREIRYVSDADIDIILDEEPVIEIVEKDDMEEVKVGNKEDDLFFEEYHEDDVDLDLVEEEKSEPEDVTTYIKEKAHDKEEPAPAVAEEPAPIEEEKKNDPFAAYRNRVNKGHGAKKVQSFKDVGFKDDEVMVREDGVKVSIKYDPFAKWRDQERKKGYGSKKVPSFKELQAMKEKEAQEKSAPIKKEEPKKPASKAKPAPKKVESTPSTKKNDPFAAYRNKVKASGNGSKKESK